MVNKSKTKTKTKSKIKLDELIKEVFKFPSTKAKIVSHLIENNSEEGCSVSDLCEIVSKDRTTVQKYIYALCRSGFIFRKQVNQERGFKFVYAVKDKKLIINDMIDYYNNQTEGKIDYLKGLIDK